MEFAGEVLPALGLVVADAAKQEGARALRSGFPGWLPAVMFWGCAFRYPFCSPGAYKTARQAGKKAGAEGGTHEGPTLCTAQPKEARGPGAMPAFFTRSH